DWLLPHHIASPAPATSPEQGSLHHGKPGSLMLRFCNGMELNAERTALVARAELIGTDVHGGGEVQRLERATAGNTEAAGLELFQQGCRQAACFVAEQITVV